MGDIFRHVLNMSLSACWLMAAVFILRPLFKRYSPMLCMAAWAFVGVRLLCPFTLESVWSLVPSAEPIPSNITAYPIPSIDSGFDSVNTAVNEFLNTSSAPAVGDSANPMQIVLPIVALVWLLGMAAMIVYAVVGAIRLHRRVRTAVPLEKDVRIGDDIAAPFVMGLFRPRIYLPSALPEEDREWVIAHERSHIRWGDAAWKLLGFMTLTVHWFNPLVWIAYSLFGRDMEAACDERVIARRSLDERKAYSSALVRCSAPRRFPVSPLAFGEVNVKHRVKAVLRFKKPALWIAIAACVLFGAAVLLWFCNPVSTVDSTLDYAIGNWVLEHHNGQYTSGAVAVEHHEVLGVKQRGEETAVYMWVLYQEYAKENNELVDVSGAHIPTVIVAKRQGDGTYSLQEYWEAEDGTRHVPSICERFPFWLWHKATDPQEYIDKQTAYCRVEAGQMLAEIGDTALNDTWLLASVKEIRGSTLLVVALDAQPISGEITFSCDAVEGTLTQGDTVKVYYDGTAQETYPVQLPTVYKVERYVPEDALADCYTVTDNGDGTQTYTVTALDGRRLDSGTVSGSLTIYSYDSTILKRTVQSGDTIADLQTVYYDVENGAVSEVFYGLVVEAGKVYHAIEKDGDVLLVIQGMFPHSSWYESYILEQAASPDDVMNMVVSRDGRVAVTYRTESGEMKTVTLGQGVQ